MNPNENNPSSPTGAGGAAGGATPASAASSTSGIPSPIDFTNPSALNTNTSSLSMADSLASAQDNLTSAGQAANTGASTAMGLGQLGANDPSASMERPAETLKPADPVPGSIGSVTSVPPLANTVAEPMNSPAFGGGVSTSSTDAAGGATGSAMPVMGAAGGAAASSATATPATSTTSAKPVQPYYNPFARTNMGTSTATSSTNVPPALQPQVSKFSDKLNGGEKKKGNLMMLLGWLLAALFAVAAIVFAILWLNAKDNERIIYRDPPISQDPVTDTVTMMNCTQDYGNVAIEGLANLTNSRREIVARFVNDQLNKIDLANIYTFADNFAAEESRGYFDSHNAWYGDIANNLGVAAVTTNLNIEGNTVRYDVSATADNLVGDYIGVFNLTPNGEGKIETSLESISQAYTNAGFMCATE